MRGVSEEGVVDDVSWEAEGGNREVTAPLIVKQMPLSSKVIRSIIYGVLVCGTFSGLPMPCPAPSPQGPATEFFKGEKQKKVK